ncbi:Outer membrane protein [Proteiniphilum saccharofermentans]|uniref:Outer membrane protein n=1 Tax=Proteiniphilum saccharofermentans TaxID=1642647 RepID=A0A1R3T4G8_9BACT|nr:MULTISPECIES: OmpA family protein [Proteiniphilum]MDY9919811.1 OmpA family protein [Proteiniphilum sp.]SCD20178.1 Outer membrane protein [Proteiniphilum saccharofermentans]SEA32881.1 Outer membrane protein OmpA [Porphyromonadaceae bacterium KH3R12]SFS97636.1 Outer membrane protein OmpA [Porphyromonadaceae bacterium NLAE-zl-C104]
MKQFSKLFAIALLGGALVLSGCGASNTVKGGGLGAGAGAAVGAGVGAIAGGGKGAAWGAGIGAVLGGTAGAIIGNKMDKQAAELEQIEGAQVEKVNEGEAIKVTFESGILFATNSSTLNTASRASLDKFATSLQNNPDTDVKIYGHTDSTGSDAINNPLSQRRAESVYNYLVSKGVSGARMASEGFGSTQPVADNNTVDGRAQNRRVEVYILPNAKMIREAQEQAR